MAGSEKHQRRNDDSGSAEVKGVRRDSEVNVEVAVDGVREERCQVREQLNPVEQWLRNVSSSDSTLTAETVQWNVCACASRNDIRILGGEESNRLSEAVKRRGRRGMIAVPCQDKACCTSTWRKRFFELRSMATLEGAKKNLYYGKPLRASEVLDVRVEMRRLLDPANSTVPYPLLCG